MPLYPLTNFEILKIIKTNLIFFEKIPKIKDGHK